MSDVRCTTLRINVPNPIEVHITTLALSGTLAPGDNPVDLRPFLSGIDWVITGCERARKGKRRNMDLDWVRDIDSQCRAADVAHFFKQYYINDSGVPCEDGVHDMVQRQAWPKREVPLLG